MFFYELIDPGPEQPDAKGIEPHQDTFPGEVAKGYLFLLFGGLQRFGRKIYGVKEAKDGKPSKLEFAIVPP